MTEDDARVILREMIAEDFASEPEALGEIVTLGQACDERLSYLEHVKQRRASTLSDYHNTANVLCREFGANTPAEHITTERIDAYHERKLRQGATPRTVQKHLVILHGVLKHAARKHGLANGAADAERVSVPKRPYHYYTLAEVERWADATPDPQDAAVIRVAAYTGLRLGELRALRWGAVDFDGRKVHVNLTHDDRGTAERRRSRTRSAACRSTTTRGRCSPSTSSVARRPATRTGCSPARGAVCYATAGSVSGWTSRARRRTSRSRTARSFTTCATRTAPTWRPRRATSGA
jgi:integrase